MKNHNSKGKLNYDGIGWRKQQIKFKIEYYYIKYHWDRFPFTSFCIIIFWILGADLKTNLIVNSFLEIYPLARHVDHRTSSA